MGSYENPFAPLQKRLLSFSEPKRYQLFDWHSVVQSLEGIFSLNNPLPQISSLMKEIDRLLALNKEIVSCFYETEVIPILVEFEYGQKAIMDDDVIRPMTDIEADQIHFQVTWELCRYKTALTNYHEMMTRMAQDAGQANANVEAIVLFVFKFQYDLKLIDVLYYGLRECGYIPTETSKTEFRKIFAGKEPPKVKAEWLGSVPALNFLIKQILKLESIDIVKEGVQWKITRACFFQKRANSKVDPLENVGGQHAPSQNDQKKIKNIISTLKEAIRKSFEN